MCWFLAGSGYLRGLIWLEGIRRNLGFIEGLELIFEHGMDGGWWKLRLVCRPGSLVFNVF